MATTVSMPQLGESVVEGTIGKLLKAPGDRVERDESVVEVMTDKVNQELPSPVAGVVERIVVSEGDVVPVGGAILVIGDGSGLASQQAAGSTAGAPTSTAPAPPPSPALVEEVAASAPPTARESARALVADAPPADAGDHAGADNGAPKRASPFVRSLARKYGI